MNYNNSSNYYNYNQTGYNNVIRPVEDSYKVNNTPDESIKQQNMSCNTPSGCSNNNPINNEDDLCGNGFCNIAPSENCCKGMSCNIDSSALQCICTYLDIIYSECNAQGTPMILPITLANTGEYAIHEDYKPCSSKCCHNCPVTISSTYSVERMKVTVSSITLVSLPNTSNILIDSIPVLNVMAKSNNSLSATINTSVEDSDCNSNNCGTKASVLLNSLGSWSFLTKIELCGKVTTAEGNCKFSINMDNLTTIPITTENTSTFVCPELCIPDLKENTSTYLNITFDADAQLINPVVTMGATGLQLTTTLLVNPKARIETIKNSKVCLNGNILNSK